MDNLRGLMGIRSMDRVPNPRIRELCGVTKGVHERIDMGFLRWFAHEDRMEKDTTARRVSVVECAGSRSVGRSPKRWIYTVKECLRKRFYFYGIERRRKFGSEEERQKE